jgi:hypothetical protein
MSESSFHQNTRMHTLSPLPDDILDLISWCLPCCQKRLPYSKGLLRDETPKFCCKYLRHLPTRINTVVSSWRAKLEQQHIYFSGSDADLLIYEVITRPVSRWKREEGVMKWIMTQPSGLSKVWLFPLQVSLKYLLSKDLCFLAWLLRTCSDRRVEQTVPSFFWRMILHDDMFTMSLEQAVTLFSLPRHVVERFRVYTSDLPPQVPYETHYQTNMLTVERLIGKSRLCPWFTTGSTIENLLAIFIERKGGAASYLGCIFAHSEIMKRISLAKTIILKSHAGKRIVELQH